MFSTLQPYIEYRGINNPLICVSALKHSPSKRKSITRPLRPLDGDFDSTGESIRSIEYLGNFLFFFRIFVNDRFRMLRVVLCAWFYDLRTSSMTDISFYIYFFLCIFKFIQKEKNKFKKILLSIRFKYKLNKIYINILSLILFERLKSNLQSKIGTI